MLGHYWGLYWAWVGGNIGAMPLETLIAALVGLIFRQPIARFVARFRREKDEVLHRALHEARLARKIAADTYQHVSGERHPHAPAGG